jgi:hypothetical protein
MNTQEQLSAFHFGAAFGQNISGYVSRRIVDRKMVHRSLFPVERDKAIFHMVKAIQADDLPKSGPTRHPIWEKGWAENLKAFKPEEAGLDAAKPRYFSKYPFVRWGGDLRMAVSEDYEYSMLATLQDFVFDKYLREARTVAEFGCGTGHNLFRVHDANPDAILLGLDWAESAISFITKQAEHGALPALYARHFDFFSPTPVWLNGAFPEAVYTVAALEQIGVAFQPWLNFVLANKPKLVLHIEPIAEVLDPDNLLDYLSLEYFKKRSYLSGYLTALRQLEKEDKIKIHEVLRTKIGSMFIEGYTVIAFSVR